MSNDSGDDYSIHFARYSSKLEKYLRKNGICCHDADVIIEESSALYFEKIHAPNKFFNLVKKHDPAQLFAESAANAIERHWPEAKGRFGSRSEIAECIK